MNHDSVLAARSAEERVRSPPSRVVAVVSALPPFQPGDTTITRNDARAMTFTPGDSVIVLAEH
ncbi:hypothetical protein [Microbispora sp. GKU 823]|uniref:hypothetical protein n=1 Tax=Microbispora sp. GKU 823 TaxID=1652100 RepID=UPI0009A2FFC9|nr:hypothetical protein [Microbispora sp. GKU 823]OPG01801.1 hypothetical protein B1L11_43770 [Microbispora sp. GKU 823]